MKTLGDLNRDLLFAEDLCFDDLLQTEDRILIYKMRTENIDMDHFMNSVKKQKETLEICISLSLTRLTEET